jgi:uroporphyrinogen decarboxylase
MKELHDHIKGLADVKLMMHTDGAVLPVIEDIIEMNVDIINPVQTSVQGMDNTQALKQQCGDRLAFHGAIDVQQLIAQCQPDQLRWEVAKRIHDLGRNGGYNHCTLSHIGYTFHPKYGDFFWTLVKPSAPIHWRLMKSCPATNPTYQ